mgnify:FL=1
MTVWVPLDAVLDVHDGAEQVVAFVEDQESVTDWPKVIEEDGEAVSVTAGAVKVVAVARFDCPDTFPAPS